MNNQSITKNSQPTTTIPSTTEPPGPVPAPAPRQAGDIPDPPLSAAVVVETGTQTISATYSPEDNKIRLYPSARLDREVYDRVRAAGFIWAPKQDLFVAPMWTPGREDLAIELAGEIEDEATPLAERAAQRAERFEGYQGKRAQDADRAHRAVSAIADNIPLGQPILVGHHSERHARKDAERITNGMRKAVQMWRTSEYWQDRARGALAHAQYNEIPAVRARRIKKLEAERRAQERAKAEAEHLMKFWRGELFVKNGQGERRPIEITEENREFLCDLLGKMRSSGVQFKGIDGTLWYSAWDCLRPDGERYKNCPQKTVAECQAAAIRLQTESVAWAERWISHLTMRVEYERTLLGESGYFPPPKKASRADKPILNYPVKVRNPYSRDEVFEVELVGITKAQFAKLPNDYKATAFAADGTHRVRTALLKGIYEGRSYIYLTDSKIHTPPTAEESKAATEAREKAARETDDRRMREKLAKLEADKATAPAREEQKAKAATFEAMAKALKGGGVQVLSAPQLFPTPADLADRMVEMSEMRPMPRVLEPSAGTGRLSFAVQKARPTAKITNVEISPSLASNLKARHFDEVRIADFLSLTKSDLGEFDNVVMNPPFINGQDIAHILHAKTFLAPGGKLVAICADGPRQNEKLKPLACAWEALPAGTFSESGTSVRTVLLTIQT